MLTATLTGKILPYKYAADEIQCGFGRPGRRFAPQALRFCRM